MDIAGPEVGTGDVVIPEDRHRVYPGDEVLLCTSVEAGDVPFRFTCTEPSVLERLCLGMRVSPDEGALEGEVIATGPERFRIAVTWGKGTGVKLNSEKGPNFPGTDLALDPLTEKDRRDAVGMGFERVAEMQVKILWLCGAAHVPVIWATQVLEGLVKNGVPTRGEMTDAAMAARTECVMLNKGPNAGLAVELLDRLLRRMAGHQTKKTSTLRTLRAWETTEQSFSRLD